MDAFIVYELLEGPRGTACWVILFSGWAAAAALGTGLLCYQDTPVKHDEDVCAMAVATVPSTIGKDVHMLPVILPAMYKVGGGIDTPADTVYRLQ